MKFAPDLSILRGLLFVFDIDYTDNEEREAIIVSKNVNEEEELAELFDILIRPDFLSYSNDAREWYISTLEHFLAKGDSFDYIFTRMTAYFDEDVKDQRKFMQVLLECLKRYQSEALQEQ